MGKDSMPRIAVLGGGALGIEVALYARYLGYPVDLYAFDLLSGDDTLLDGPFREFASPLGVAALWAQYPEWECPKGAAILTTEEYRDLYLRPLAKTDLVWDTLLDGELMTVKQLEDGGWQIETHRSETSREIHMADLVVDLTGEFALFPDDEEEDDPQGAEPAEDAPQGPEDEEPLLFGNPVADFFVMGQSGYLFGLAQIRELFAILGDREDLDVYATMPSIQG